MITIRDIDRDDITGYLGNKLFQIAAAHNLAKRNGDKLILPHFEFENIFETKFFDTIYKRDLIPEIKNEYSEPSFHHKEIPYQPDLNLVGYFQSWKYCEDVDFMRLNSDLVDDILFSDCGIEKDLSWYEGFLRPNVTHGPPETITCGIHVRRGDYLNLSNHHPVQTMEYYEAAMKKFPYVENFIVFSNDIEWCKKNFIGEKFVFCNSDQEKRQGNKSTLYDFVLMSHCTYNIIANSSYSWWAARLNSKHSYGNSEWGIKETDPRVVCPANWFGPALAHHNTKDLYPENWIRV